MPAADGSGYSTAMSSYTTQMIIFAGNVSVIVLLWTVMIRRFLWPAMARQTLEMAVLPLLVISALRVNGLCMLIPGVVASDLPSAFANAVAYGDVLAALIAVGAIAAFGVSERAGRMACWLYTVVGVGDLMLASVQMVATQVAPAQLQGAYFLVVVMVPSLMIMHALIVSQLLRKPSPV